MNSIHYIQGIFNYLFSKSAVADLKMITQCAYGWVGVMKCNISHKVYRITVEEIKSEVEVKKIEADNPLMYSDFESEVNNEYEI